MARLSLLSKAALWLVALGVLAVLFVRSAQRSREAPFTLARGAAWTLTLEPAQDALGSWLTLTPPPQFAPPLGRQIFSRAGESIHYPNPAALPLILRTEYDRALAGVLAPDAIVGLARTAGLESTAPIPRCMARRRVSEPGSTRSVYFVMLDVPAFGRFRQSVSAALRQAGRDASTFDPTALAPALIVAATDEDFSRWLPLGTSGDADCIAPIEAT
jgi:hypothetical protein